MSDPEEFEYSGYGHHLIESEGEEETELVATYKEMHDVSLGQGEPDMKRFDDVFNDSSYRHIGPDKKADILISIKAIPIHQRELLEPFTLVTLGLFMYEKKIPKKAPKYKSIQLAIEFAKKYEKVSGVDLVRYLRKFYETF